MDDDGNARYDHTRIIGVFRYRLRLFKIVEADVTRAPRGHPDRIGTGRFPLRKVDRNFDIGVGISGCATIMVPG